MRGHHALLVVLALTQVQGGAANIDLVATCEVRRTAARARPRRAVAQEIILGKNCTRFFKTVSARPFAHW